MFFSLILLYFTFFVPCLSGADRAQSV